MITDYKRAREDAAFLVEWTKSQPRRASIEPFLEALAVMNGHDAINFFAMVLLMGGTLPKLPDGYENDPPGGDGVPETGA
jgi:hypothetical protein